MRSTVWRIVAARFISRNGTEAAFFIGVWGKAAYEFGGSVGQIAIITAALGISGLIGSSLAGVLVDRFDARRVLIASEIVFVPVALSFIVVDGFGQLAAATFGLGLVASPINTAIASMPPFVTETESELAVANARLESATMGALITGTAIGALLVTWVNLDAVFLFDAVTSIVAVLVVVGIRLRAPVPVAGDERAEPGALADLLEGLRFSIRHDRLRFYLLVGASVWLMFGVFSVVEPLFFRDVLERGPETIGWVNAVFGIGLLAGTVAAARLPAHLRSAKMVLILMGLNGAGSILYVGTADLRVVVAGGFVWGIVIGLFLPLVRTMVQVNSPERMMGRITGVAQMLGEAAKLMPLVFAPLLVATLGIQGSLISFGLLNTALAGLVWGVGRRLDRTRAAEVPPLEVTPVIGAVDPGSIDGR